MKFMKKIITTTMLGLLICGSQYSQEEIVKDSAKVRQSAIGISFGSGLGIQYSRTWKPNKLYATASFNSFAFTIKI